MIISLLAGVLACVVAEPEERTEPESDCADGIDNNGNGLVDCDDPDCGGINCRRFDTGIDEQEVEIVIDQRDCCDFTFNPTNCNNRLAGTIEVVNRTKSPGLVTFVRCDPKDFGNAVGFRVGSDGIVDNALGNVPLAEESSVVIEAVFDCQTDAAFTAECEISATAGTFGDDRGFLVRGSFAP